MNAAIAAPVLAKSKNTLGLYELSDVKLDETRRFVSPLLKRRILTIDLRQQSGPADKARLPPAATEIHHWLRAARFSIRMVSRCSWRLKENGMTACR
jgi:hypothetical protein